MKINKGPLIILIIIICLLIISGGYYLTKKYGFIFDNRSGGILLPQKPDNINQHEENAFISDEERLDKTEIDAFEWCMANGGQNITPDYTTFNRCRLDDRLYESDCVSNDKYFVIREDLVDSVGTNILIKYKTEIDQEYPCKYVENDNDFVLSNKFAEYVRALEGDFLITDSGTGPPPRGLGVYDLVSRKKIFNDSYSKFLSIKNNIISYWSPTDIVATEDNCPEFSEYSGFGLGAGIDEHVTLDLTTLNKEGGKGYHCTGRQ